MIYMDAPLQCYIPRYPYTAAVINILKIEFYFGLYVVSNFFSFYLFIFAFRLLNEHDCNIFANMQKTDFREFRNLIIEMVLHTDMSQHFSQLKAIKSMIQQNSTESR